MFISGCQAGTCLSAFYLYE